VSALSDAQIMCDAVVRTVLLRSECGKALSSSGHLERGANLRQHPEGRPTTIDRDYVPCHWGALKFTVGRLCFSVSPNVCASEAEATAAACLPCAAALRGVPSYGTTKGG
jgi:hypothetical protein